MRKRKFFRASALTATLILLAAGTACSDDTESISLRPAGYKLTALAYVVPVHDGRDTVELIETQAAELTALKEYLSAQNASLEQIAGSLKHWKLPLRRSAPRGKRRPKGLRSRIGGSCLRGQSGSSAGMIRLGTRLFAASALSILSLGFEEADGRRAVDEKEKDFGKPRKSCDSNGGRYWVRTNDFHRVKVTLYR